MRPRLAPPAFMVSSQTDVVPHTEIRKNARISTTSDRADIGTRPPGTYMFCIDNACGANALDCCA